MTDKERINILRDRLRQYNDAYYKKSKPLIDDRHYDELMRELEQLEKLHPELASPDSPTKKVGNDISAGFVTKRHAIPMLSLDNTYSQEEAIRFMEDTQGKLNEKAPFMVECKIDGLSICCHYEFGRLTSALTRGDGLAGDDVLQNIMTIPEIPKELYFRGGTPTTFEIRGEVFMRYVDFKALNEERERSGEALFANPRNAASGTLKTLDRSIVAARHLHALFYGLGEVSPAIELDTQDQMYALFQRLGIPYEKTMMLVNDRISLVNAITAIERAKTTLGYPIDGAVIKLNSFPLRQKLGETTKYPRWAKAYKYEPDQATTKVKNIVIQVGRTGTLTPVAEFDPVYLSGSTVRRATLHNEDFIRDVNLGIGDLVIIEKAGEIIPQVVAVKKQPGTIPFDFQKAINGECPVCHTKAVRLPGMADWRCQNPNCPARLSCSITHLASRDALDIDGIGTVTADTLVSAGIINKLTDLFTLDWETLAKAKSKDIGPLLGKGMVKRIEASIRKAKEKSLSRWLYGLGIEGVGIATARTLAKEYVSLRNFVDSFRPNPSVILTRVNEFLQSETGNTMLKALLNLGYNPVEVTVSTPLTGRRVAFHGIFDGMSRLDLIQKAVGAGAIVVLNVSKATDYLVAGSDDGHGHRKVDTAKRFGIPIITEEDFLKMVSS